MRPVAFITISFLFTGSFLFGQDPCEKNLSKKYQKLLEEGTSAKGDEEKQKEALREITEELPEAAIGWLKLGVLQFRLAEKENFPSYKAARTSLETALQLCPEIDPLLYYYLGVISYSEGKPEEALSRFRKFVRYEENPGDKDHFNKLDDVRKSIPVIEEQQKKAAGQAGSAGEPRKIAHTSTAKSEYLPMLSPDNTLLFFTRKYEIQQRGDIVKRNVEEFSQASRLSDDLLFEEGKALKAPFNTGPNYGGATFSLNNKEMFIVVCIPNDTGYRNCDIYRSRYIMEKLAEGGQGYMWGDLKPLPPTINRPDYWEAQPSVSPDGSTLYFTRYGKDTRETDIYYSVKDSAGNWSEAQPLGEGINTAAHDKAPFIHQDGYTLYFSSSRKSGAGFDIYISRQDSAGNWSQPENIGPPVNTPGDEHGLLVSTDGKYAIYATNTPQEKDNYDLYVRELPQKVRPEDIVLVKGKVQNADENTHVNLKKADGSFVKEIEIDKDDGAYATIIRKKELKEPVLLTIEQEGAAFDARLIDAGAEKNGLIHNRDLTHQDLSADRPFVINDINFETNKSVLSETSKLILNEFALFLKKNPQLKVVIQGHTDNVGSDQDNLVLSQDRALTVTRYLISKGVAEGRLTHKGFGASQPVASNDTAEGRAKNRRTEFQVLK